MHGAFVMVDLTNALFVAGAQASRRAMRNRIASRPLAGLTLLVVKRCVPKVCFWRRPLRGGARPFTCVDPTWRAEAEAAYT